MLIVGISALTYFKTVSGVKLKDHHLRGAELISFSAALKKCRKLAGNARTVYWGFLNIPASEATNHFAIVGTTGSGKTMSLRMLMQSVLPYIGQGEDVRALIYDAKSDMLPILETICPETVSYTHLTLPTKA